MPELPEAEATRKLCAKHLCGHKITRVQVKEDPIVFCGQSAAFLQEKLTQQKVIACHRRGKYFWWSFERDNALLLHLGMTGAIHVPDGPALELSHGIDFEQHAWPPRFTKLQLELDNGQRLAFCDPRRFGRVKWQHDPLSQAPLCKLGPDPIAEELPWTSFERALSRRKGAIKSLLLNQAFIAGIGNWIADEVLYQAAIDPRCPAKDLSPTQRRALYDTIHAVLKLAVSLDADSSRFPQEWLFHHRWGKKAERDSQGQAIEFIEIAGRTTAWVPSRQRPAQ